MNYLLDTRKSAGLILFFGCLWLVAEYILFGKYSVVIAGDNSEFNVPGFLDTQFLDAPNPLWHRFSAAGLDRLSQAYFASTDVFLFTYLPGWLAHGLLISSYYYVSVLSVYALSMRTLGFGQPASLFVAFAWGIKIHPYLISSVYGYLPLVILSLTYLFKCKSDMKRWGLVLVSLYLIASTAYFSRLVPGVSVTLIVWFLFVDTQKNYKNWLIIIVSSVLLVAFRVGDILALLSQASIAFFPLVKVPKSFGDALYYSLSAPIFHNGPISTLSTFFFIYALFARKGGDWRMKSVAFILLLGNFFVPLAIAFQIALAEVFPFVRGYSIGHIGIVPRTILVFAGGYGVQTMIERSAGKLSFSSIKDLIACGQRLILAVAVATLVFVSVKHKYASLLNWVTQGSFANNFESPVLQNLAMKIKSEPWPVRAEYVQLYPNHLHAYGIETAGGDSPVFLRRYYEFWGTMATKWVSSLGPESTYFGNNTYSTTIDKLGGWLAFRGTRLMLMPEDYKPERHLNDLYNLNMLSLANVAYFVSRDRLLDKSLTPVREMDAPWSSLSHSDKTRSNVRANFTGRKHLYIYKNRDVFPRFFTVGGIKSFKTGRDVLEAMSKTTLKVLRSNVFVEEGQLPKGLFPGLYYGTVDIHLDRYTSDEIRLTVSGDGPAILIVGNSFSPYWVAEIDGVRTPIFPAYHAFWGVALSKSAKSVVFRYRPPYQ